MRAEFEPNLRPVCVVLQLPVRICTSTCIPQVNSAAIRIGRFAFRNSNQPCKNHEGGKVESSRVARKVYGCFIQDRRSASLRER